MKKTALILILMFFALIAIYFFLSPAKDEFVEEDLYNEIMQRGYIKVGINTDSKPFGFYDKNGNIIGYDADLSRYIAQYLLKNREKVKFVPITPSNRLIKASTGQVDIVISTVTITPARQEVVSFSIPYDIAGQAVLVKSNSSIKSISDLANQTVGVIFGTTAEKNMKVLVPTANVRGFTSYAEAYKTLKSGNITAITSDDTILSRFVIDDSSVRLLPKRYSKEPYGIAFKKGSSTVKLKENIDFAIKDMQQKNVINRLRKYWNVDCK
ncbi:MAG: transporter substrate-binding domain-containing protein [bacterium]|nr:transporter substrate-binding domain-containing protein [bacterium]